MTDWTYYINNGGTLVRQKGDDASTAQVYRLGRKPGLPCRWVDHPNALKALVSTTERFDSFDETTDRLVKEIMANMERMNRTQWAKRREMERLAAEIRRERERKQRNSA